MLFETYNKKIKRKRKKKTTQTKKEGANERKKFKQN